MKRAVSTWLLAMGLSIGVMAASGAARADAAGDKVLAAVDSATYQKAKTQMLQYDATIQTPDKPDRKLTLSILMKGEWRLSEFLAPSDVKGTKVLILSPTQMYVYLPAFGKVRRIASHVTDQGFMGMNFTQDDMSISAYAKMYTATIASDDGKQVKLNLVQKPDSNAPYPKIELTFDKATSLPGLMKYFSDTGTLLKTETRSGYTCDKGACAPTELKMIDHTKTGQSTTLVRTKWKVNEPMDDSKFSKRAIDGG